MKKLCKKKNNKYKIKFSLFSAYGVVGIFIMMGISILYTLTIYSHLVNRLADTSSHSDEVILSWATFLFLSMSFTAVILIYRKFTVKDPIMKILKATERIGSGDFSVRLPVKKRFRNEYDVIFENINKLAEELAGIETLRQDFVSNVSHEFKAPLALIQSSSDILMRAEITEEERQRYAQNISDSSKHLASMVTNVLKLNKIENQKIPVNKTGIDLTEQLRQDLLLFEREWDRKNIDIDISIEEDLHIEGDKELTSLIWTNLFSNAFKFTPENGKVSVFAGRENGKTKVSVSDTGPGIPGEQMSRIFEKFYQGDASRVTSGNGLGLAIVKSVADMYGYRILVDSEEGKGSKFTVII